MDNIVKQNVDMAITYLTLAENVTQIFYYDKYRKKDIKKALDYHFLAASKKEPISQRNVGLICMSFDIDKAIYYLERAANQNIVEAQYQLGKIFQRQIIILHLEQIKMILIHFIIWHVFIYMILKIKI